MSTETLEPNNTLRGLYDRAAAYVELTKPGILQLLVLTTICAMFVAERGVPSVTLMAWTLIGTVFVCGSANTLNMVWDRDIDQLMGRTAHRPLVTARATVAGALIFAAVIGLGGLAILFFFAHPLAAVMGLAGHLFYVIIYTMILKRRTPQNIVIGGAAGAFPPLIGYAAVTGSLDLTAWIIFGIIFLWTPPHFWALALYKKIDYGRANVPMMPVVRGKRSTKIQMLVYMVLLLAATMLLTWAGTMGILYSGAAVFLGLAFTYCCVRTLLDDSNRWAKRTFAFSIVYLGLLFGAMSADSIYAKPIWAHNALASNARQASHLASTEASRVADTARRIAAHPGREFARVD